MKAERDDLVLRVPSALKAPLELCGTNSDNGSGPDTPLEKITRDLRGVAGSFSFLQGPKWFLTNDRFSPEHNKVKNFFLPKAL